MYPTLHILGANISTYRLMFALGVAAMILLLCLRRSRYRLSLVQAILSGLLLAVFGVIGAKLLFIAENWRTVLQSGITPGGMSFFGTVFLLPAILALTAPLFRMRPLAFIDYCTPAVPLMLAVMRIGCFFTGCCGGVSITLAGATFPLPVQLFECALDFLILDVMLQIEKKHGPSGALYPLFMLLYGIVRFLLEFFRMTEKVLLRLSNGQYFSILCIVFGGLLLFRLKRKFINSSGSD
ncbi:prolipoprotein diacylglyceryl transferase [Oscillospiraceae bacterium]|nr:prolipoprotein diacylglyceryl transferase [Oscillospiraceae bacterium]BDF74789.1 prolipoprotein diacylglyceryl transferase [Oscillospiraceae bacterium]